MSLSIKEWGINHEDIVTLVIYDEKDVVPLKEENKEIMNSFNSQPEELLDLNIVENLKIEGYTTIPSNTEIARMSKSKASSVTGFTLQNQHGRITWEGSINLLTILDWNGTKFKNLAEIVEIEKNSVEVYRDDNKKPPKGEGLNRPAIITLFNLYPKKIKQRLMKSSILSLEETKIVDDYKDVLRQIVNSKGGLYLRYEQQKGELHFSVSEF